MDCKRLSERLDERLRTDAYADIDASANGLQIGPATRAVEHAAFAVDGAVETIERAGAAGADVLVTHHGISWGGIDRVTGRHYEQVATAIEHGVALYCSHLPLDGHQRLGNAAGIGDLLGLEDRSPFGSLGGEHVGQQGTVPDPIEPATLRDRLEAELDTGSSGVRLLDFGPDEITDVAIVTGSGVDCLGEAAAAGADVLVTGEGKQQAYHEARERGVNVVLGGHYATETFGVQSLQDLVEEWGVETTYIDCPTGL